MIYVKKTIFDRIWVVRKLPLLYECGPHVYGGGSWKWLVFTCLAGQVGRGWCQRVWLWQLGVIGSPSVWSWQLDMIGTHEFDGDSCMWLLPACEDVAAVCDWVPKCVAVAVGCGWRPREWR